MRIERSAVSWVQILIEDHTLEIVYIGNNFWREEENSVFISQAVRVGTNMFDIFLFASRSEFPKKTCPKTLYMYIFCQLSVKQTNGLSMQVLILIFFDSFVPRRINFILVSVTALLLFFFVCVYFKRAVVFITHSKFWILHNYEDSKNTFEGWFDGQCIISSQSLAIFCGGRNVFGVLSSFLCREVSQVQHLCVNWIIFSNILIWCHFPCLVVELALLCG